MFAARVDIERVLGLRRDLRTVVFGDEMHPLVVIRREIEDGRARATIGTREEHDLFGRIHTDPKVAGVRRRRSIRDGRDLIARRCGNRRARDIHTHRDRTLRIVRRRDDTPRGEKRGC